MKVSGFTIIRNGTSFDYPYLESMRSLLPLVDELIINVGRGDDNTLDQVRSFAENEGKGKTRWFESHWPMDDPSKKKGGLILSEQTNLALDHCTGDWCIYLQGDEVLHEADYPKIRACLEKSLNQTQTEGLTFDYIHFYGSFDVYQQTRSAYRREVRIIRRVSNARSIGDAQSFRKRDHSKLQVVETGARIFHYGWVRKPEAMQEKTYFMDQLYHGDPTQENERDRRPHTGENYRYKRIWGLKNYRGTHPHVMQERIQKQGWHWDFRQSPWVWSWKDLKKVVLDLFERATGYRLFEYRSYRIIRHE